MYQISNDLPLGQSVSFQYKAITVSNLSPSIYVSSPVYLYYVTLPPSLAPREGRKYEENTDQVLYNVFLFMSTEQECDATSTCLEVTLPFFLCHNDKLIRINLHVPVFFH